MNQCAETYAEWMAASTDEVLYADELTDILKALSAVCERIDSFSQFLVMAQMKAALSIGTDDPAQRYAYLCHLAEQEMRSQQIGDILDELHRGWLEQLLPTDLTNAEVLRSYHRVFGYELPGWLFDPQDTEYVSEEDVTF